MQCENTMFAVEGGRHYRAPEYNARMLKLSTENTRAGINNKISLSPQKQTCTTRPRAKYWNNCMLWRLQFETMPRGVTTIQTNAPAGYEVLTIVKVRCVVL